MTPEQRNILLKVTGYAPPEGREFTLAQVIEAMELSKSVCAICSGKGYYQQNSTEEKTPCRCQMNNWEALYNLVKQENEAKGKKLYELETAYNKLGIKFDKEMTRLQERSMNDINRIKELEDQVKYMKGVADGWYRKFKAHERP